MSSFTNALITRPLKLVNKHYKRMLHVESDFTYEIGFLGSDRPIVIPRGFLTDGVSVPALLRWALPIDHMLPAAVLHDWLLSQLAWEKSRADLEFKIAMRACGVRQPYREIAYWAVHFNRSKRAAPTIHKD